MMEIFQKVKILLLCEIAGSKEFFYQFGKIWNNSENIFGGVNLFDSVWNRIVQMLSESLFGKIRNIHHYDHPKSLNHVWWTQGTDFSMGIYGKIVFDLWWGAWDFDRNRLDETFKV